MLLEVKMRVPTLIKLVGVGGPVVVVLDDGACVFPVHNGDLFSGDFWDCSWDFLLEFV